MRVSSRLSIVILGIVGAVFLFGLVQLFALRFEQGDIYPPYSSLRADPLGCRALYGALSSLRGISVRRNLEPISRLKEGHGKTLLFCGASLSKDPKNLIQALEAFVAEGARLVITFSPVRRKPRRLSDHEDKEKDESEEAKAEGEQEDTDEKEDAQEEDEEEREPWLLEMVSIEDRWGFTYAYSGLPGATDTEFGETTAAKQVESNELPASLTWHTALHFEDLDEAWETLYAWDGHSAIIERPWGRGTIVLCSDSYFVSNEAMRDERRPGLLAWVIGPSPEVIFDETHIGIEERPGVMTLMREYHLVGLLGAVMLVVALLIWKNAVSLTTNPQSASPIPQSAQGRDSTAALVNLLRRSIPSANMLQVCTTEWERSSGRGLKAVGDKQVRIRAIVDGETSLPLTQRDPVKAYRAICRILAEKT